MRKGNIKYGREKTRAEVLELIGALPCAIVEVSNCKVSFCHVPHSMGGKGAEEKIARHVEKCVCETGAGGNYPKLKLDGRQISFVAGKEKSGKVVVIGTDTTETEIYIGQLREKIGSLEKFRGMAVNRELRMMELKGEIDILKRSLEGAHA